MQKLAASTVLSTLILAGGTASAQDPGPTPGPPPEPTALRTILPKLRPNAQALAIDSQGRAVALGGINRSRGRALNKAVKIARVLPDGQRDLSFGKAGATVKVSFEDELEGNTFVHDGLAIDSEDRIYATVEPRETTEPVGVIRFLPDGTLDDDWGDAGVVWLKFDLEMHLTTIALDPTGGVLVGLGALGEDISPTAMVARLDSDGTRDEGFGKDGTVSLETGDRVDDIAVDSEGRIVVSTWSVSGTGPEPIYRLLRSGDLDDGFGKDGSVSPLGNVGDQEIVVDGQDRVVLSTSNEGARQGVTIARVNAEGRLDEGFGDDGTASVPLGKPTRGDNNPIAIDGEGRIVFGAAVVTGANRREGTDIALARLTPEGEPDAGFGTGGKLLIDYGGDKERINAIRIAADGAIVTAGAVRLPERPGTKGVVASIPPASE